MNSDANGCAGRSIDLALREFVLYPEALKPSSTNKL
jgi:hypothetical protein